jgi:hypothetical protein
MRLIQLCVANCCALLFSASVLLAQGIAAPNDDKKEEIYVMRSVMTSRVAPTEYCAQPRTGFDKPFAEYQFAFRAVETHADDGMVVNPLGKTTASLHACTSSTVGNVYGFYGEGEIAGTRFSGKGQCTILRKDFPEPGLAWLTCFLDLTGLKSPYVGGLLTTNSLFSRNPFGEKSDPPGYTQVSIATVRLWKGR